MVISLRGDDVISPIFMNLKHYEITDEKKHMLVDDNNTYVNILINIDC